jgi:hypothetical protein
MGYKEQTGVQDAETIRIGSVKFEIGPYGGGYTDVGALVDAAFKETWTDFTIRSDNAGIIEEGIGEHMVEVTGTWWEINVANLGIAFAGIGTAATVAAAPVSITDEAVTLNDYDLAEFTYKNGDGSEVASIVVADAATPTITYIRDCDYVVVTKANGYTAIARAYPTVIEGPTALCAVTGTTNYFLSAGSWDVQPAVGDHIYVSGFTEAANNGAKTVTVVTADTITVSETLVNEVEGDTVTIVRGAIQDAATVYADYDYTPLVSRTYTSGGNTTKTARIVRLTNENADGKTWTMLIHKAYIGDGIDLQFPSDDDRNPIPCPIRLVGRIDTSRTSGDQLFNITDTQDTT